MQQFKADGTWVHEISLTTISAEPYSKVARSPSIQPVTCTSSYHASCCNIDNVIHEFNPTGEEVRNEHFPLTLSPREPTFELEIHGIALDSSGRLAVSDAESSFTTAAARVRIQIRGLAVERRHRASHHSVRRPSARSAPSATPTWPSTPPANCMTRHLAMRFSATSPCLVGELLTGPVSCKPGAEHRNVGDARLHAEREVDPGEVPETRVWFESGSTPALGSRLPEQEGRTKNPCAGQGLARRVAAERNPLLPARGPRPQRQSAGTADERNDPAQHATRAAEDRRRTDRRRS